MSIISGAPTHLRAVRSAFGRTLAPDRPLDANDGSPAEGHLKSKGRFRPDVEGLRAVAVGAVLLYHAGVPFAPGGYVGVDVFFVISGFLITGLLLRELEKTGTISLALARLRRPLGSPAVIGDVLVYRNGAHLTATYVRTLTPWLAKQLPEPHR